MRRLRPALVAGAVMVTLTAAVTATATGSSGTPTPRTAAVDRPASRPTPSPTAPARPTASDLLAKVRNCTPVSDGRYAMAEGDREHVPVCRTGSVYFWTSDMAIDCDGEVTDECNPDTDSSFSEGTNFKTSTGDYFTADTTHYFVIPLPSKRFDYRTVGIKPGNVGAVIYNGKVVYAVFADLGPKNIIGEASYATANDLGVETDPSVGGTTGPVTFIVFPGVVPDPVEDNAVIDRVGEGAARSFVAGHAISTAAASPVPAPTRAPTPKPSRTRNHAPSHAPSPSRPPSHSPSPSPSPSPSVLGVGPLTGLSDGCVDVQDADSEDGTAIQLYGCNNGPQQTWTVGSGGTLRSLDKCLAVRDGGTADGTGVVLHDCDGSQAQQWNHRGDALVNAKSGKCLDVRGNQAVPGVRLQIWTCTRAKNQRWHLPSGRPSP